MFTDDEKQEILLVKERIEEYLRRMAEEPWAQGVDLPWGNVFLTGGVTVSLINKETPKDFDFYFDSTLEMIQMSEYLKKCEKHLLEVNPKYSNLLGTNGKMVTAQAITMKGNWSFITMVSGTPQQVRNSFDFVHCKPYYSIKDRLFYISEEQYRACKEKKLVVNNESMVKPWRRDKFIKRGFKNETRLYS